MIPLLVFSKNRAMQLDLLLRSIKKNCPIFHPYVVYKTTSDWFDLGYDKLVEKQYLPMTWKVETSIKEDLLHFLKKYEIFCITTDDTVIYRQLNIGEKEIEGLLDYETICVSLRLGLNCTTQNWVTNEQQPELSYYEDLGKWIKIPWISHPPLCNWAYWAGQDFVCYRSEDWLRLLNFPFSTMREVESKFITEQRYNVKKEWLTCLKQSVAFSIPANSVQEPKIENKFESYSEQELNNRYLRGELIDLAPLENMDIRGCHVPADYEFLVE